MNETPSPIHVWPLQGPFVEVVARCIDTPKFPLKQTAEMSGVHPKRIQQWIHRGQLKTKYVTSGTGDQRQFTFTEIGQIVLLQELSDSGIPIDLAVTASKAMGTDVRRHLVQMGYALQSDKRTQEFNPAEIAVAPLFISVAGEPKVMELDGSLSINEAMAEMGSRFFVFDTAAIIGKMLTKHLREFFKNLREEIHHEHGKPE